MKQLLTLSAVLLVFVFALPAISVRGEPLAQSSGVFASGDPAASTQPTGSGAAGVDASVQISVLIDGTVTDMTMDKYLAGVVAAEMPASFELEALNAQAVAARTYAYYKMLSSTESDFQGADLSDDPDVCCAYIDMSKAEQNWGGNAAAYRAKIEQAVAETDGITILYNSQPIFAAFHSSSNGHTEAAVEVWGGDLPYLQSVSSPETENAVPNYYGRVEVEPAAFKETFLAAHPDANLNEDTSSWFGNQTIDDSGRVVSITIGGVSVPGTKIRTLFSLRSTTFSVSFEDGVIVFRTTGYGHGVGMSQYGANTMAKEGKTYDQILKWYYTGVELTVYNYKKT